MGMRVVYDPISNTTFVVPVGQGGDLPDGSIARESPVLSGLTVPDSILLVGQPIRYQLRFLLEAVGEDWDRSIRPINDLTYAPQGPAVQQIVTWTPTVVNAGSTYFLWLNHQSFVYTAQGGDTAATICTQISGLIGNAGLGAKFDIGANVVGGVLRITGPQRGYPTFYVSSGATPPGRAEWQLIQAGRPAGGDWSTSAPPSFWGVTATQGAQATSRLTKRQARQLAEKCIYKMYRIVNADPNTGKVPLTVPGFGKIVRREQILLQDSMIEQVLPHAGDDQLVDKITGEPLIKNLYDSYQKNRPAECYGSYFWPVAGTIMPSPPDPNGWNSAPNSLVGVPFSIDPDRQLVIFSEPVYFRGGNKPAPAKGLVAEAALAIAQAVGAISGVGSVRPAQLVLQTACQVRHPVTNQVVRAEAVQVFGGGKSNGLPLVIKADDFEINFLAQYPTMAAAGVGVGGLIAFAGAAAGAAGAANKVIGVLNDLQDANKRAKYYLLAEAAKWELKEARERVYNGIVPVQLDGALHQASWEVGPNGAMTTISRNSEHALHLPSYPERLRIEFLRGALKNAPQAAPVDGKPIGPEFNVAGGQVG